MYSCVSLGYLCRGIHGTIATIALRDYVGTREWSFGRINFILYLFFYTCNTQYPPVYILLITLKHKKERIFFFLFF